MNKYERHHGNVTLYLDLAERITLRSALRFYLAAIERGEIDIPDGSVKDVGALIELITPAGFDSKEGKP